MTEWLCLLHCLSWYEHVVRSNMIIYQVTTLEVSGLSLFNKQNLQLGNVDPQGK